MERISPTTLRPAIIHHDRARAKGFNMKCYWLKQIGRLITCTIRNDKLTAPCILDKQSERWIPKENCKDFRKAR
jgi:hypothetical protein